MNNYAQTNIQLFNQLKHQGYSEEDLIFVHQVYQFAMEIFTGVYRPSGKTFISHIIGVASILARLNLPIKIVVTGLIHSIYMEGDFGTTLKDVSDKKRAEIKNLVGAEIEEYLYRYCIMGWNLEKILQLYQNFDKLDESDRIALLIRLVDQLEDMLDFGVLYFSHVKDRLNLFETRGLLMIEMAEKLGFPSLSMELQEGLNQLFTTQINDQLCQQYINNRAFLIPPKSYSQKLLIAINQNMINLIRWIKHILSPLRFVLSINAKLIGHFKNIY